MKDVFDIIAERNFNQLSKDEFDLVSEVCADEDEFMQMKLVLAEVNAMNQFDDVEPSPKVKASLDDIFAAQTFPKTAPIWYNKLWISVYPKDKKLYQRPLIQVAAVLLLIVGILPMVLNSNIQNQEQMAKLETPKELQTVDSKSVEKKRIQPSLEDESTLENLSNLSAQEKDVTLEDRSKVSDVFSLENDNSRDKSLSWTEDLAPLASKFESKSMHPDGVFAGAISAPEKVSITVSEQPEILDLLTATF